jgi:hypothetical protein
MASRYLSVYRGQYGYQVVDSATSVAGAPYEFRFEANFTIHDAQNAMDQIELFLQNGIANAGARGDFGSNNG